MSTHLYIYGWVKGLAMSPVFNKLLKVHDELLSKPGVYVNIPIVSAQII